MAGNGLGADSAHPLRVVVSSTSEDLKPYRAAARDAINAVGWWPNMMENFGARPTDTVTTCQEAVANSDLVVLIVAHRRGWVPREDQGGNGQDSITALELQHARRLGIPVLIFLADDNWPLRLADDDGEARAYVKRFRSEINQPAAFFVWEPEYGPEDQRLPIFRSTVRDTLRKHQMDRERAMRHGEGGQAEAGALALHQVKMAGEGLRAGTRIPLLGPGVFGNGPLSTSALISALIKDLRNDHQAITGDREGAGEDQCLASVAEYQERLKGRDEFLNTFRRIIDEQSRNVSAAAAHRLVANFKKVPLIISASCDRILEQTLDGMGIDYVVIAHVLRSFDDAHNGKVLVERSRGKPSFHFPSELDLSGDARIIYKPMGSPTPLRNTEAELEELELDTVVATETDHYELFCFLQNQQTGVPPSVIRKLQRWPLVYIGYALDVWQFRLMTQVFRAVGPKHKAPVLAIRGPRTTELEAVSWNHLGAQVIPMYPDEFANRLMTDEAARLE
jgi:hypothetical protein